VFSLDHFDNADLIGISVSFPLQELFKRFLTKDPELLRAKLAIEKSKVNFQAVRNSIELEIIQDYTNWDKAKELAASAWNKVKVKEARVNEGQMRSKEGLITMGEYMGYINSYQEAYNEFEVRKREEYNALLTLLKNAGMIDRFLAR
jgi:outer membrane protein TolC